MGDENVWKGLSDDERSVIGEKGEIGFVDYEDDRSVCSYNPAAEGPVVISVPFPFNGERPQSVLVGETRADVITIENTTSEPVELWSIKIYGSNPEDTYTLSLMEPPSTDSDVEALQGFLESFSLEDRVLQPYKTLKIWLLCKPKDIGVHATAVQFDVGDNRIERMAVLLAEDKISQSIVSKKPYSRGQRRNRDNVTHYVAGRRPAKASQQAYRFILPKYDIPMCIRETLARKEMPDEIVEGLTRGNYGAFFSMLIIMEELKLEEEMKNHDMEFVTMSRRGYKFLTLEVPGLAERRPSLVIGDFVYATPASNYPDEATRTYQGFIHRVEADEVLLLFSADLHNCHRDGNLYNIRFTYNRTNMRRLYQAVQAASKLHTELLFPSLSSKRRSISAVEMVPLNHRLNEEQKCSVEMILGCRGVPPYVIHGPPGTGKTMTLIETILQLYTTRKSARILVCASSNSAADHILEKLIGNGGAVNIEEREIFRLNASSRPYEDLNPEHIRFCYYSEDQTFKCPPTRALAWYRIIISTYMSSSLLYAEGIKPGHFSHIFLDEAGQASEPETMIPISHLCRRETVVVLAGDPMQLGPVIYSRDAENYGLGMSYLDRLFDCEFYSSENANYVTKLVRNYRCHQAILELPSKLFYKGELVSSKEDTDSCSGAWESLLPNKDFPVLFVGIQGCDEREGNNPSWFNRIEASKVVDIIKKLTASGHLTEADIGVITPYRQQVSKLKKILEDELGMLDIKVGSVEQFQGQEREVIIISTVRSTVKHNTFDKTYSLGFLSNPRRFNVAITRARSLLIIVGNPHIICQDQCWDKLLRHCTDNNSYQGCSLPERQDYSEDYNVIQQPRHEGEWGYSTEQKPSYEGDGEDGWNQQKPSKESGWGDRQDGLEPVNGQYHGEWHDLQPSNGATWGDNSFNAEIFRKPITDEVEWSD